MAKLQIVTYGCPVLHRVAEPIGEDLGRVAGLASDMLDTVKAASGIGLAAPQVGYSVRMVIVDLSPIDSAIKPLVLLDPVILEKQEEETALEGCLSVPDIETEVKRAKRVVVRCKRGDGKSVEFKAENLFARVIQHELDHLDGKLIIDYQNFLQKNLSRLKLKFSSAIKNEAHAT
ncbi:MAG: peptide deformylase [Candidatus Omnitrophica bacterium]|nr:peptide deformylase [Candidatus Omnitrophota bacterium]